MLKHQNQNPEKPNRVFILGINGFVGSHLANELRSHGIEVAGASSKEIDLLSPDSVKKLKDQLKPTDAVVFISALAPSRGRDAATLVKNMVMADHFSRHLSENTLSQLVFVSSDAVYDDSLDQLSEDSAAAPGSLHGHMCRGRELILSQAAQASRTPLAIVRPVAIYGAGDPHNGYGPNRFIRSAISESKITLFGEGEEKRDHVHVGDVAAFIRMVLEHRSEGVVNLATGHSVSFGEIAREVMTQLGKEVELDCRPRANPITHKHFDTTQAAQAFPEFRFVSLREGLKKSL